MPEPQVKPPTKPTRILLLTHSRTASHVLERMLSNQPSALYQKHPFLPSRIPKRDFLTDIFENKNDPDTHRRLLSSLDECYVTFTDFCTRAANEGRIAFVHTQPHMMLKPPLMAAHLYGTEPTSEELAFWRVGLSSSTFTTNSSFSSDDDNKESSYTNPTVLPDVALLHPGTIPVLNFRNPLLLVESHVRAFTTNSAYTLTNKSHTQAMIRLASTLRWARRMYDWYLTAGGPKGITPILVDADDYLAPEPHRHRFMDGLCARLGLDADRVVYGWARASSEEIDAMSVAEAQAYRTLLGSEGVMDGFDTGARTLEGEMERWKGVYGVEGAGFMGELVGEVWADYVYLRGRRLVV